MRFAGRPSWFASATDRCRAQVALHTIATTPSGAPLRAILTENSGVGDLGVPIDAPIAGEPLRSRSTKT